MKPCSMVHRNQCFSRTCSPHLRSKKCLGNWRSRFIQWVYKITRCYNPKVSESQAITCTSTVNLIIKSNTIHFWESYYELSNAWKIWKTLNFRVQWNPVITTPVFATPRPWRPIFCGINSFLTVKHKIIRLSLTNTRLLLLQPKSQWQPGDYVYSKPYNKVQHNTLLGLILLTL